jgi:hypothetical protein
MQMSHDDDPLEDDPSAFEEESHPVVVTVEMLITALYDSEATDGELNETICYGLSNLSAADLERLLPSWEKLDVGFRQRLLAELSEIAQKVYDVDYSALAESLIDAEQPEIRIEAIGLLMVDFSRRHMQRLMHITRNDTADQVRSAAMAGLGKFILAAELGEIDEDAADEALALAEATYRDTRQPPLLRGQALEALANSSAGSVNALIADAYASPDARMRISAVTAMGNSCDEMWEKTVIENLRHADADMRAAAARAAGALPVYDALPMLGKLIHDEDRAVQEGAIYALGQLGDSEAIRLLEQLLAQAEEEGDADLIELIHEAIDNATLGGAGFALLDLD